MADTMCAALIDTRQHFPKLMKLWKQFQKGSKSGSLFPGVEEYPHELLFSAQKLGGDFGGDNGDSGDDLREEGELLAMIVSPIVSETRDSAADLVALQSKTLLLRLFSFAFICFLIDFLTQKYYLRLCRLYPGFLCKAKKLRNCRLPGSPSFSYSDLRFC